MFFRNLNWDIIGQRRIWFGLSLAVILAGAVALFLHHGLRLGLSFTGGSSIEIKFNRSVTEAQVRAALARVVVQHRQGESAQEKQQVDDLIAAVGPLVRGEETVQLASRPEDKQPNDRAIIATQTSISDVAPIHAALNSAELSVDAGQSKITAVGPSLGQEYLSKSLWAMVLALGLQLLYIAYRFGNQLRYGVLADVKLIHDILVMVGIYAVFNKPADDAFLAALLTVIGWSVMDSIVIFDRIRENTKIMTDTPYDRMVNTSLLQTMTRSVNTLATVLIVLLALYLFGGDTLKDFAFALLVGVTSGAYSSIFIASPLLVLWHDYAERKHIERRAAAVASATASVRGPSGAARAQFKQQQQQQQQQQKRAQPKAKRPAAPPPRYRRKRTDIGTGAPTDGANVGVLTDGDDAAADADASDGSADER